MTRFAASLVGPDAAEDVVSEVVVRVLRRGRLADLDSPEAYLMKAVLNAARSRGRRAGREARALEKVSAMRAEEVVVEVEPSGLTQAVMGLPAQQRAAVYLVYWEDLEPHQAADLLGVRPSTLRRYLFLARHKLKGYVDE